MERKRYMERRTYLLRKLKRFIRHYKREEYTEQVDKLKKHIKNIASYDKYTDVLCEYCSQKSKSLDCCQHPINYIL